MATTRLTRVERKALTRADLLTAARSVFLRRGFHFASLDEIAEEAGYTKGAIYSNFRGKDDLFLALLAEHYQRRAQAHRELLLEVDFQSPEETRRAIARGMLEAYEGEPAWWSLVADFSTHASRHPELRNRLRGLREEFLGAMADLIVVAAERHDISYTLPAQEVARGTGALMRGLMLDWILGGDDSGRAALFEETVAAFLRGVIAPRHERSTE